MIASSVIAVALALFSPVAANYGAVQDSHLYGSSNPGVPFDHGFVQGSNALEARIRMTCRHGKRLDYVKVEYLPRYGTAVFGFEEMGNPDAGDVSETHTWNLTYDIKTIEPFLCGPGKYNGLPCGLRFNGELGDAAFSCGRIAGASQGVVHIAPEELFRSFRGETMYDGKWITKIGWSTTSLK